MLARWARLSSGEWFDESQRLGLDKRVATIIRCAEEEVGELL